MSTLAVNAVTDANGGNTATINSMTPTADSLQGFRNRIINGDMRIDQRNAGASVNITSSGVYALDRFVAFKDTSAATLAGQQSTTAPSGFTNSLLFTVSTGASPASSDDNNTRQRIEGFNVADLGWGTASAKEITLSFWVRSSVTGTFGLVLSNSAGNRAYYSSYSISAANTFEYKTITIPGDTSGTWLTNNGTGIGLNFDLGTGTSRSAAASTAWGSYSGPGLTGGVKLITTTGATWYITGVQLEVGSVATPFERRPYGTELSLCQRYYEFGGLWREGTTAGAGNQCVFSETFKVQKRANATFTFGNVADANANITSIAGPEALYESISPHQKTNLVTGFAFRFVPSNATSTIRQYWTASSEL